MYRRRLCPTEPKIGGKDCNRRAKRKRLVFLGVHRGVGGFHFTCCFKCGPDLEQLSRSETGAILRGAIPFLAILNQLRPKRKQAALYRFGRMDATSFFEEKITLSA